MIGIGVMLFMAVGVLFFVLKHQRQVFRHQLEFKSLEEHKDKELLAAYMKGEEEERKRIAGELHDDVACTLASIKLLLSAAQENEDEADELLRMSKQLLDDSLGQIRGISHRLLPSFLIHIRLEGALKNLLELLTQTGKITAGLQLSQPLPLMADTVELSIFRVVQELINNLIKHAGPTWLTITSDLHENQLQLILQHDGEGLDQPAFEEMIFKKDAIGLKNIVSRLKQIDASVQFSRASGQLYQILLTIPRPQATAS